MIHQIASLIGAFCVLGAYIAHQRGWLSIRNRSYSAINLVGSLLLVWVAIVDGRLGFILLNGTWALVSIPPLFRPPVDPTAGPSEPVAH